MHPFRPSTRSCMFLASEWMVSPGSSFHHLFSHQWPDHKGHMVIPTRWRQDVREGILDQSTTLIPSQRSGDPQAESHESPKTLQFLPGLKIIWSPLLFLISNFRKILRLALVRIFFPSFFLRLCFWFIQEENFRLGSGNSVNHCS